MSEFDELQARQSNTKRVTFSLDEKLLERLDYFCNFEAGLSRSKVICFAIEKLLNGMESQNDSRV